ncbi:MAG: CRISPR-associated protein Csx20 [Brevinematia bacterium]
MPKLLVLLNHTLTDEQITEAKEKLKVTEFVEPPIRQKNIWAQMPSDENRHNLFTEEIIRWIKENAAKGDFILVQGEFGATFTIVDFCLKNGFVPIYATSERKAEEVRNPDGSVEKRIVFKHMGFRKYRYWE